MKCPERTKRAGWSQHRGEEGRESLGGYNVKMCKRQKKFLDTATSTQNLQHMFIALLGVGIYQSQENVPFLTGGGSNALTPILFAGNATKKKLQSCLLMLLANTEAAQRESW